MGGEKICFTGYFNPRSPHGERHAERTLRRPILRHFNPRSPHGERPGVRGRCAGRNGISTHAPRTGSDRSVPVCGRRRSISTHAPRTGSDRSLEQRCPYRFNFNPRSPHGERRFFHADVLPPLTISTHAPRTGSDAIVTPAAAAQYQFQPTLPARGATIVTPAAAAQYQFQPTLPARGATLLALIISTDWKFQPTLPARGATVISYTPLVPAIISTHAPRTGSDWR